MLLHQRLEDAEQKGQLAELIFSQKFGKRSFNLDVPERNACMEALFTSEPFDETGHPEFVENILARFHDLEDQFPQNCKAMRSRTSRTGSSRTSILSRSRRTLTPMRTRFSKR